MPIDEPHRERKLQDKNRRLNKQYDELYELEEKIDDLLKKRKAVESNALNLEQVYQILLNFDKLYNKMTDTEQRKMVSYLIKRSRYTNFLKKVSLLICSKEMEQRVKRN